MKGIRSMPESQKPRLGNTGIACPVDKMCLLNKKFIGYKGHSIAIAVCPYCNQIYSNSADALQNQIVLDDGREVLWSRLQIIHADNPKKRRVRPVTPEFENLPVTVVAQKSKKALLSENIITATNSILPRQISNVVIQGYYNLQAKEFFATPEVFTLKKIPKQILHVLDIRDPNNILSLGKKNREFLAAWKNAISDKKEADEQEAELLKQKELHKQAIMRSAYPGQLYTVPLLRSSEEHRCPYCRKDLQEGRVIKCVVYKDFVPHHCVFVKVSFCKSCDIPISTQREMAQIRKNIAPDIIKVVYADDYSTKEAALAACYKKVERLEHKQPPKIDGNVLPYPKINWGRELPNLSALPESDSIFVYAKKCNCKKCQRRFGRDTIADRKATVLTKNGKSIDINVQFCMGCGRYFMNLKSLYTYQSLYGDLKITLHFDPNIPYSFNDMWVNFSENSVLSRNGYNVKAGTSIETRQRILRWILNEGIATKHEVISLLTQFIQLHQTTKPGACDRWREDLLFVNQLEIDHQNDAGRKNLIQGARININQKE